MTRFTTIIAVLMITAAATFGAEDVTTETPSRLAPAVGISSSPLSVGYRLTMADHYGIDLLAHIPVIVTSDVDGGEELSGVRFGGLVGYSFPMRLEENVGFMLRPQLDFSFLTQGGESSSETDINRNVLTIRPGVFAGIEIFMEEVGIPDLNVQLGITAGSKFESETVDYNGYENSSSSFYGPLIDSDNFGATLGIWWFF